MARGGQPDRAILAFETALRFAPKMHNAGVTWRCCIERWRDLRRPLFIGLKRPNFAESSTIEGQRWTTAPKNDLR
jgi:hypothetical protein